MHRKHFAVELSTPSHRMLSSAVVLDESNWLVSNKFEIIMKMKK